MLQLVLRGLVAGFVIVLVTEIARLSPRLAAILLFVPLAIPVVFVMMYLRNSSLGPICRLSREALLIIPLSLPMFLPFALAQRLQFSFWTALCAGLVLAAGTIAGYLFVTAQ